MQRPTWMKFYMLSVLACNIPHESICQYGAMFGSSLFYTATFCITYVALKMEKSRRTSLASCMHFFPSATTTTTTATSTAAVTSPGAEDPAAASDLLTLPSGQHRFPFDFPLARSLPSTFDGQWGQLHYSVKATLDRPWKHALERERPFVVFAAVCVIDDAELTLPIHVSGEFQSGMFCCVGQPVRVEMTIERRGYTIGDSMPFKVDVRNTSKRKLYETRVALLQHATFRAGDKTKRQTKTVCSVMKGEIRAGSTVSWHDDILIVPRVPPTSCKDCKVVQLKYTVAVCIHYSVWSQGFTLSAPIVIGTIPLKRASTGCSLDFILGGISLDGASRRTSRGSAALPLQHSFTGREGRPPRQFHLRQMSLPDAAFMVEERPRHHGSRERSASLLTHNCTGANVSKTLLPTTFEEREPISNESSPVTFT